ncbi:MAG: hypothetical protein NVSMB58_37770 [Terriglobales bacterium]
MAAERLFIDFATADAIEHLLPNMTIRPSSVLDFRTGYSLTELTASKFNNCAAKKFD